MLDVWTEVLFSEISPIKIKMVGRFPEKMIYLWCKRQVFHIKKLKCIPNKVFIVIHLQLLLHFSKFLLIVSEFVFLQFIQPKWTTPTKKFWRN